MSSLVPAGSDGRTRPHDRYGQAQGHSLARRTAVGASAVLLIALAGWWIWVAVVHANPAVRFEVTGFDLVTDTSVTVEWVVDREPGTNVDCVLRARDQTGAEVGRLRVPVPASATGSVRMRELLETSRRPVTGEVLACVASSG